MTFLIDEEWAGRTILAFVNGKLKISSSALAALKRDEMGITVDGRHVTVRHVLEAGQLLVLNERDSFTNVNDTIAPVDIKLDIIFENEDIIVINKPANMPTHPSHNHHYDTVANGIAHIYEQRGEPLVFRPMGRLDKNTSGILVLSKHAISAAFLSYARRNKLVKKGYIAILCGKITSDGSLKTIDNYMKRTQDSVIMRCVTDKDDEHAMHALTHWRLLYSDESISVVEAFPQTGRTHQLRVHFASIGHPILGDDIYGTQSEHIDRHALHAAHLSLPMPYTDNQVTFTADIPSDMKAAFLQITGKNIESILHLKSKETYDI